MDQSKVNESKLPEQLYLITVEKNTFPLLLQGNVILLYSQRDNAVLTAKNLQQSYNAGKISVHPVENNISFFSQMIACGLNNFLLDGNGTVFKFSDYYDPETAKAIIGAEKLREEIENAQPTRKVITTTPKFTVSSVVKAFNVLNVKQKRRFITAYVCGLVSLTSCTILGIFQHHNSPILALMFFLAIASIIKGLDSATGVSTIVKERNPVISKAAMLSCLFHLVAVIVFAVLMTVL